MNKSRIIDFIRRTSIIKDYNFYKKTESFNTEFVINEQENRLSALLMYVKNNNVFYKSLLSGYSDNNIISDPIKILNTLPITNKKFLSSNYNKLFSPDKSRHTQIKHTGGSTGEPFYYHLDSNSISLGWSFAYYFWNRYAGYNPGDPYGTIAGNSLHSSKNKFLELIYHKLQNNYFISGDIIKNDIILNKKKLKSVKLIYGYPSSISVMMDLIPEFRKYLTSLRAIFTTSEVLIPQIRKKIEEGVSVKVFDMYGANDGGISSCECMMHNGYHYNMLNSYIETVKNEHGLNELIVTSLNTYSFPIVRYKVGDLGEIITEQCRCGSPYHRIINLKGRTRDLIFTKDKVLHGSFFNSVFLHYPEIKLYKIIQEKDYSINLQLLVNPEECFHKISDNVSKELKKSIGDTQISILKMRNIETSESKFKIIENYAD